MMIYEVEGKRFSDRGQAIEAAERIATDNKRKVIVYEIEGDGEDSICVKENEINPLYVVFWVGGDRDGKTLGEFNRERDAISFAKKFHAEHEEEFDELCGGVGINYGGEPIEW